MGLSARLRRRVLSSEDMYMKKLDKIEVAISVIQIIIYIAMIGIIIGKWREK